ncbi:Transposon en spm sub-class [Mycena sanguinolenta]|uniref:Transposon en spm sub-class n=1 Tax=Mycena sanguinolenta TaxID=230812 RepID=A0A8H6YXT0_9AGAR|nr:Transposon en spm sub-class [Mycena sanguinolenta]
MPPPTALARHRRRRTLLALLFAHLLQLIAYAALVYQELIDPPDPIPYHTSILSGQGWVDELYNGHPNRINTEFGVRRHIFNILIAELRWLGYGQSRYVSLEEKLGDIPLYVHLWNLPTANTPLPQRFMDNPLLFPFFENALGGIDGTHIPSWPSKEDRQLQRDRKGQVSQNVLCCCSFDMRFQYAVTGYDGSAADATMFSQSRMEDFRIPEGKYYLADAGFPNCKALLVPYRGVRYHLNEWLRSNQSPQNPQELFNLRHAQARNVIERIFGVLKSRWGVLRAPLKYDMEIQARVPVALMAIHNLILKYDLEEDKESPDNEDDAYDPMPRLDADTDGELASSMVVPLEEQAEAEQRRDLIANAMWEQHVEYLRSQNRM